MPTKKQFDAAVKLFHDALALLEKQDKEGYYLMMAALERVRKNNPPGPHPASLGGAISLSLWW